MYDRSSLWLCIGLFATLSLLGFQHLYFEQPISLQGDHFFALKVAREAIDGTTRFNTKLGAPLVNDNLHFPLFDFSYKLFSWVISNFTSNIFTIISVLYIFGVSLMYVFAFWALRVLGIPALLASIASIAFVVSPYFALRSFSHDYLSLYYSVPLGASLPLAFALTGSREEFIRLLRTPYFAAAILFAGTSGVYYGAFVTLFLALGMTMIAADRRQWTPFIVGFGAAALILTLLVLTTYGPWLLGFLDGTTPSFPERGGAVAQLYHGLSLSNATWDYFNIGLWVSKFDVYQNALSVPPLSLSLGKSYAPEWPGVLITTVILVSVSIMPIVAFAKPPLSCRTNTLIRMSMLLITFGVVFSIRGGLGFLFNFMVISGIRAQERIIPFLSFYALVILCISI